MDDEVDAVHRHLEAIAIAHVADEIAHALRVELLLHLELLEFVARIDDQLSRPESLEQYAGEFLPERTGASGDQYVFVIKHGTSNS